MELTPQPKSQEVAARAYQLYLQRGRQPGHEMDDWLQAEYELMQLPVRKLAEMPMVAPVKTKTKAKLPAAPRLVEVVQRAMLLY